MRPTPALHFNDSTFLAFQRTKASLNYAASMQEPTHILAGVIIQKSFEGSKHPKLALGLTAIIGFLSHGFLDKLANLTYHPAKPDFHSPVWVGYHSFVVVATVAFLVLWWRKFKWRSPKVILLKSFLFIFQHH